MIRARIVGTGSAVPEKILTNQDLEKLVDTSDEWIVARTGIRQRHIAASGEYTSTFAIQAARNALNAAGIKPEDLDLILLATVTPDMPFPATSCIMQHELGAKNAVAFDISAACAGFIYGLNLAENYIRNGTMQKILVVGAEVLTRIVDFTDRNTCILFGDGAGAVVLEADQGERGICSSHIFTNGDHWDLLYQPGVGSRIPATAPNLLAERLHYLRMSGNDVFKYAVRAMGDAATKALEHNGIAAEELAMMIPHQANLRIIEATGKRLGVPEERTFVNLHKYGNTSSASIPIAMDEANRAGMLHKDDLVLLAAFGGGFTYGSALIRW